METIILQWNPNQKWPSMANMDVALMHLEHLAQFRHLHQQTENSSFEEFLELIYLIIDQTASSRLPNKQMSAIRTGNNIFGTVAIKIDPFDGLTVAMTTKCSHVIAIQCIE